MPRRQKIKIKLGDKESLQALVDDIFHDTTTFKNQIIREINIISAGAELEDDHALFQIAKVKSGLLGLLNTNTSNKLLLAKMVSGLMDNYGSSEGKEDRVTLRDFSAIRKMLEDEKRDDED